MKPFKHILFMEQMTSIRLKQKKDANELFLYERYTKSHKKSYTRILIHTAKSNASQLTK